MGAHGMLSLPEKKRQLNEGAAFLRHAVDRFPAVGIVCGTGLGALSADSELRLSLPYSEIPHFPTATGPGHEGQLQLVHGAGCDAIVLQGRFHLYEGHSAWAVAFPVRVLAACGLQALLVTNAAGGLNPDFNAGDLMLITDHINMTGENPLAGEHAEEWGPRFPDMTRVYDPALRQRALDLAAELGLSLRQGVYVGVKGPSLETPAETAFFAQIGADAIGMSTVLEVIAAVQCGLRVCGIAVITNVNLPAPPAVADIGQILSVAAAAAPGLARLITGLLTAWPDLGREQHA
jgi:purine-nucleoside phosphorylase